MVPGIATILQRFTGEWAALLQPDAILAVCGEIGYTGWREYDPEDTARFYALRLHEAGMIKLTPQKIIAQSTDWRFLNELKKELKG
jgi:NitT/TauT family transport system substrate-binding protein